MSKAKMGDTIRVHYTGKLQDGTVFDSSGNRGPFQFTLGQGQVIPGFEQAVVGLSPGEKTTADIPPERAYGPYKNELVLQVERERFPENIEPSVGQKLQLVQPDKHAVPVTVKDVSKSRVTLDGNHPLAGKNLSFEIQLLEILPTG